MKSYIETNHRLICESPLASIRSSSLSSDETKNEVKRPVNAEESPELPTPEQVLVQFCDSPIINRMNVSKNKFSTNQPESLLKAFANLSNNTEEVTVADFVEGSVLRFEDQEASDLYEDVDPDRP